VEDRQLLELAAKAAGYEVARFSDDGDDLLLVGVQEPWNPLLDDGEALRLAVNHGIDISHNSFGNVIADHYRLPKEQRVVLPHVYDPCAATRRAIVSLAAQIGEST